VVSGFIKAGYPQQLLPPGLTLLKEWAYAGATFTWLRAAITR
jgi:hypothetical protein